MNFPFLKKNKTKPKGRGQISLARRPARPNLSELTRKSASPYLSPISGAHLGPFSPESVPLSVKKRMRRDPQIRLGLNIIKAPILALDFWVEGDDGQIAAFVEAALRPIWRSLLRSSLNAVDFGFQPHEKVWKLGGLVVDGPGGQRRYSDVFLYKKIKDLDPAEVALLADERGDYAGFRQGEVEVAAEKTFVMTAGREWGNLYGRSRLDFAYEPWYWAAIMYMFCNRYFERKGDPPILGRAPAEERLDKDGATINTLDEAATVISNLKAGGTAVFPDERDEAGNLRWDFQYLLDDKRADQFLRYIEHLAVMKLRALLVPERVLTQDTSTGSYAMARAHTETFLLSEENLLQEILDHINKYLVPQLVEYNFGPDRGSFQVRTSGLSRTNLEILKDVLLRLFDDDGAGTGQRLRDIIDISKVLEELDIPKRMEESEGGGLAARLISTDTGPQGALKERLFEHPEIADILEEQRLALYDNAARIFEEKEPLEGLDSLRVKFVGKLENALKRIMLERGEPADNAKKLAAYLARNEAEEILQRVKLSVCEDIQDGRGRQEVLRKVKETLFGLRGFSASIETLKDAPKKETSDPRKYDLRRKYLKEGSVVADLFAGRGNIAEQIYLSKAKKLILVEKDDTKFHLLKRKFGGSEKKVLLFHKNNFDFIAEDLGKHPDIDVVDFDAYGVPSQQIIRFFEQFKISKPLTVFVTDGIPNAIKIASRTPEFPDMMRKFYLYEVSERDPKVLLDKFPQIHRRFIRKLGNKHGFAVEPLESFYNKGKSVLYAAYRVMPS